MLRVGVLGCCGWGWPVVVMIRLGFLLVVLRLLSVASFWSAWGGMGLSARVMLGSNQIWVFWLIFMLVFTCCGPPVVGSRGSVGSPSVVAIWSARVCSWSVTVVSVRICFLSCW